MGKRKTEIVFDEAKRRKYLTGFSARKQERIRIAREKLNQQLKDERERIKQETKNGFKNKMKKTFSIIPELTEENEEEYDTENVSVQIVELPTMHLANELKGSTDDDQINERKVAKVKSEIPGMGLIEEETSDNDDKERKENDAKKDFGSRKQLMKMLNKENIQALKHSKAFQMKKKLDQKKDRKKARLNKKDKLKSRKKNVKTQRKNMKNIKTSRRLKKGK